MIQIFEEENKYKISEFINHNKLKQFINIKNLYFYYI